tara:strand:- start:79 stop:387 length:309 start_codon:yes stop_codon:yes gene_type:complete
MIGFITNEATADAINDGIAQAQTSRGLPVYWQVGKYPIYTGEHAGGFFMPFDETIMATNLRGGLTPQDFPEFGQLVAALGGLEARVDLDPQAIIDPNAPTDI